SFLATALIGIVVSQTVVMLEVWEPFMEWFESTTGITNFTIAWTVIFAGAMLIPVLLMLISGFISSRSSGETLNSNFMRFGYALIPLGLGIHLAHNAKHFFGEVSILNMPTIQVIQYILSVLGILGAMYTAYRISKNNPNSKASVVPYLLLILAFGVLALWMYSVPMAARGH
ncbi:MAG: hypothetical protein L6282_15460, partial [Candidatus Methanoperedenaceae archaeon]|nr:hypothetical protein [Candidatus Methanoperedenaceae archaeon]